MDLFKTVARGDGGGKFPKKVKVFITICALVS